MHELALAIACNSTQQPHQIAIAGNSLQYRAMVYSSLQQPQQLAMRQFTLACNSLQQLAIVCNTSQQLAQRQWVAAACNAISCKSMHQLAVYNSNRLQSLQQFNGLRQYTVYNIRYTVYSIQYTVACNAAMACNGMQQLAIACNSMQQYARACSRRDGLQGNSF